MRLLSFLSILCVAMATRSVIIGDSLFWSGAGPSPLVEWLSEWAGHEIENHAMDGASLESIRDQYQHLEKRPVITTLIMDGGGSELVNYRSDCEAMNEACRSILDRSVDIAKTIMDEAIRDGVDIILYLGPYSIPGLEDASEYASPRLMSICEATSCYFVDPLLNITTDKPLHLDLAADGIQPTPDAYKILAKMIWAQKMRFNIPI